ncbi:MAG: T9SS type A sorting domain-containing protein [Bacteroidetes bacterium]|nr:T9SS type A sorting domain-containing protein [Bacteroidota bacterium]
MFVKWKHKSFSKENNAQGLCLFLAGAGFLKNKRLSQVQSGSLFNQTKEDFDVKKITFDYQSPNSKTKDGVASWQVVWNDGSTEIGSSGSPLFNTKHQIIGQLYGGEASCSTMSNPDYFGRFASSWTGGGTTATQLKAWLDPGNTNAMEVNSYDPFAITFELDATPVFARDSIPDDLCKSQAQYIVTLRNKGTDTLTSVLLIYEVNGNAGDTLLWTGNLPTYQSEEVTLPAVSLTNGPQLLSVTTTNPNNKPDQDTSNDLLISSFYALDSIANVTLTLFTDGFGDETSWSIKNDDGVLLYSESNLANDSLYKRTLCLDNDCYIFEIIDFSKDGICCDYGNGFYSLVAHNGDTMYSNYNFNGSGETSNFCFPLLTNDISPIAVTELTPLRVCKDQLQYSLTLQNNGTDTLKSANIIYNLNNNITDTVFWTGSLAFYKTEDIALPPLNFVSGNQDLTLITSNPNGSPDGRTLNDTLITRLIAIDSVAYVTLVLFTDGNGDETSWSLKDNNGVVLYSDSNLTGNKLYTQTFCLENDCYEFEINDSYGDGICCANGDGYYSLTAYNGDVLRLNNSFNGTSETTKDICVPIYGDETTLTIYYDPTTRTIIPLVKEDEYLVDIEVFTFLGQLVYQETFSGKPQTASVFVATRNPTIYIVRVTTSRERLSVKVGL